MRTANNGQRMLAATDATLRELATALDVHVMTVSRWRRGETVPRAEQRAKLLAVYGIPLNAWERNDGATIELPTSGRPTKRAAAARTKRAKRKSKTKTKRTSKSKANGAVVVDAPAYPPAPAYDAPLVERVRHSLVCIGIDLRAPDLSTSARSKLRSDEARTVALLAKLEREHELTEPRYVREHPEFRRHCERVLVALKPYPDALRAVVEALAP